MIYTQIIRLLGGLSCFLFCYKSSGLCKLYHLKRMSFPVKKIKCEQQNAKLQIKIALTNYLVVSMSGKPLQVKKA